MILVLKQSGCLTQESNKKKVILFMTVVLKRTSGPRQLMEGLSWVIFYMHSHSTCKLVLTFPSFTFLLGDVWPGPCVFPDFPQSKARLWWSSLVKDFTEYGVDGIWNDMNEPAVFKVKLSKFLTFHYNISLLNINLSVFFFQTVTKTMPETNVHRGDAELGGCQSHAHYHNASFFSPAFVSLFSILFVVGRFCHMVGCL